MTYWSAHFKQRRMDALEEMGGAEVPDIPELDDPGSEYHRLWRDLPELHLGELERRIWHATDAHWQWIVPGKHYLLDTKFGLDLGQSDSLRREMREREEATE